MRAAFFFGIVVNMDVIERSLCYWREHSMLKGQA